MKNVEGNCLFNYLGPIKILFWNSTIEYAKKVTPHFKALQEKFTPFKMFIDQINHDSVA